MISYSTAADNSAPALNLATFFAGIVIVAFVEGLIPVLSALSLTEKVPKPTRRRIRVGLKTYTRVESSACSRSLGIITTGTCRLSRQLHIFVTGHHVGQVCIRSHTNITVIGNFRLPFLSESGCKGKCFFLFCQTFRKFFFEKVFSGKPEG